MRAYWILPNRDQNDDVFVSDGRTIVPLRQILDPNVAPPGFSHGVPTEILEKCGAGAYSKILFAQRFPNWSRDRQIFSVMAPAGFDFSGRVVHLGILFILEANERPQYELSYAGMSKDDQTYAKALIDRMKSTGPEDCWAQSVRDLSELPSLSVPGTNVALDRSRVRFRSLYVIGPNGMVKKTVDWRKLRTVVIILLIFFAAGFVGFLYIHR